jgi:hypothetical protein
MNKLPVYLYSKLLEVILDLDQNTGIHKIMYQRKLKLQKGFKDSVQIQFKNGDQKPVSISSGTYYFDIIDSSGRQLVLSKPLTSLEVASTSTSTIVNKGLALATFDPADTINLTAASYKFVVKQDNPDGTYTPVYSNTYYGITGEVEIAEDGFPIGYPIQTVELKQLESSKQYDRTVQNLGYIFTSEWLRPVVRPTTSATTSSVLITLASFKGTITVEGTLDNNPSSAGHANTQVFTVAGTATTYTTSTVSHGTIELTWSGAYTAVRFKVRPANDNLGINYYPTGNPVGTNTNKFPSGFVDQIQYIS